MIIVMSYNDVPKDDVSNCALIFLRCLIVMSIILMNHELYRCLFVISLFLVSILVMSLIRISNCAHILFWFLIVMSIMMIYCIVMCDVVF